MIPKESLPFLHDTNQIDHQNIEIDIVGKNKR